MHRFDSNTDMLSLLRSVSLLTIAVLIRRMSVAANNSQIAGLMPASTLCGTVIVCCQRLSNTLHSCNNHACGLAAYASSAHHTETKRVAHKVMPLTSSACARKNCSYT
jgi:hypothetical protein